MTDLLPQLRTTDLERSIRCYAEKHFHPKLVGVPDPWRLRRGVHETDRNAREFVAEGDHGHALIFYENLS